MQQLGLVEWDRPSFLFLLFIAWAIDPDIGAEAIEFRDLPKTVELEETAEPNSVVTTFSVSCTNTSDVPEISLKTVTPVSSFFEHLILSAGNYQVRLSPSAALDARVVNLYALTFTANCTGETKDAQLFVQVNETKRLVCNEGYTDIGRLPIQVSEDARPGETIYTTVLKRRGTGKLTFTVENSSLPFVVTSEGVLQVPATGFTREQAGKTFSLKIVIKDATSISCEVPLSIQVNPVYHNKVSFRESSVARSIPENVSPLFDVIQVRASGESVLYQIISPITNYFTIEPETGIIRTTYYLDLKKNPSLANTQLEVKAYNMFHHVDHASITVNITVKQENLEGPLCSPAVIVTEVPEDFLIGSTILPLSCYDPENINSSLTYNIVNQDPPYSFKMDGPNFQVNSSLDCDSESMATRNFQYNAAILVIDEGSPAQTTTVSVLVTVRQVNEFLPKCSKWVFYVPENTEYGYSIGNVNGSDQDYPFNNIEYSIMDGDARVFYINSHTGQLHVLLPLDFEDQKVYHLAVILKDLENEAAPGTQKTTRCNVTIFVQDVNDRPPKCKKPFLVYSIYSTQATDIEITDINCEDEDRGNELTYNIVRGKVDLARWTQFVLDSNDRGNVLEIKHIFFHGDALQEHQFDGRAQDPVSGQYYLFDSSSGARRWV